MPRDRIDSNGAFMNDHTREMIEENELNGYAKIDQYNPVVVGRIADRYRASERRLTLADSFFGPGDCSLHELLWIDHRKAAYACRFLDG